MGDHALLKMMVLGFITCEEEFGSACMILLNEPSFHHESVQRWEFPHVVDKT
jgi:hypothetical protein